MYLSFLQSRPFALGSFFLAIGVSLASWITRTPSIRDALNVSISEMGVVLFGLSVGSMTGILSSGSLIRKVGTRQVISMGMWLIVVSMGVLGLSAMAHFASGAGMGFALFGLGMGLVDIAINLEGSYVEAQTGRHLLHNLHGFFSLGTVIGALAGIAFNAVELPIHWHFSLAAFMNGAILLSLIKNIPPGFGTRTNSIVQKDSNKYLWKDRQLLLIGMFVLAMALAEGAAHDWLPLLMVDAYGMSATLGSLIFLMFAVSITAGRFTGGLLLKRFQKVTIMQASAVLSGIGLCCVIFAENELLASMAVVLWGLGAALGFPIALSMAGESESNSAERVKLVAICGYVALLVSPPMLGFAGEEFGLRSALLIVLVLITSGFIATRLVSRKVYEQ